MFEFNLQTAVFFGTIVLGASLFVLGVLAFLGTTVMLGAMRWLMRAVERVADSVQERMGREEIGQDRSQPAG